VLGTGKQWVSWIHIDDLVRLFQFALDTPTLRGVVNAVAPTPATHLHVQRALAARLHRPLWLRVSTRAIRAALGEMAQLLVDGQRVVPAKALASGFLFRHPHLQEALDHLVGPSPGWADTVSADIFYNGACPVCLREMNHYAALCAETRLPYRFIDSMQHPDALASSGLRREHLERRVYMRDANGRILSGMPALIALWSCIPRYHRLARTLSLPILQPASAALYDHIVAPSLALWARARQSYAARASASPDV
jgi:predicted DCC family thiol-disulfide oxidoreductase YuxK